MNARPQLADKTLDILEAIAQTDGCSLPYIVVRCGIPSSTAHRLIQALVARGYVTNWTRGRYRIGTAALALTRGTTFRDLLREASRPYLAELARKCRSHAHLGVFEGNMVTYLVKQRFGRTHVHSAEGLQLEAYCSAVGKILLAHLSTDRLDEYIGEGSFIALTPNTITDAVKLRRELAQIRRQGWALDLGEISSGLGCVAVPLLDAEDKIYAALSVSILGTPLDTQRLLGLLPMLSEASAGIRGTLFPCKNAVIHDL